MNDRQRVELLLIPQMMSAMVEAGVADPKAPEVLEVKQLLRDASTEALRGLTPEKHHQINRRMVRAHFDAVKPFLSEGARMDKLGLSQLYMLQAILDDGYLVLNEGSSLAKALESIVAGLEHAMSIEKLDASAKKQGRKMLQVLQGMGYYEGVAMGVAA